MTGLFPSFGGLRAAILSAPERPAGFPLEALRDPAALAAIRAAPHRQPFLDRMRSEAARAASTPPEPLTFALFRLFETTGDRAAYERVYFDRYRRLAALALVSAIDATDDYLPALSDLIWDVCQMYTWALPAHLPVGVKAIQANRVPPEQVVDLFAAHLAHALAEVASLLGERLDPWLHYRIRTEVERRIFRPVFDDPRRFAWESLPMNWAAVCGGCVGMAALILVDDRERLAGMLDRMLRALECFLEGFGADGGCPEGIGYWVYGFGFYAYFAETLRAFTAGGVDLLQGEHVRRIAAFPGAVSLGAGRFVNFSDAPQRAVIHPGLGSRLAARLGEAIPGLRLPDFDSDPIHRWGHVTRDLVWTAADALDLPVADGTFFLPEVAWLIDRRAVAGGMVAFSAKGGHNAEPHNHNDLGHFILHVGGETLLADLGAGVYTRQYFGAGRYDLPHTGSQGHSVPQIDGQPQQAGADHAARVLAHEVRPDGVTFALDLTRAYADPNLDSFVRAFEWTRSGGQATLRLTDSFRFGGLPAGVEERFISLVEPQIEGGVVRWTGASGSVRLTFDPEQFAAEVDSLETQDHDGAALTAYRLRLRAREAHLTRSDGFLFDCRLSQPA